MSLYAILIPVFVVAILVVAVLLWGLLAVAARADREAERLFTPSPSVPFDPPPLHERGSGSASGPCWCRGRGPSGSAI